MLSTELGLKTEMTKLMLPCSPFGHGKLIKERNDGIEVIELPWILAGGSKAILYRPGSHYKNVKVGNSDIELDSSAIDVNILDETATTATTTTTTTINPQINRSKTFIQWFLLASFVATLSIGVALATTQFSTLSTSFISASPYHGLLFLGFIGLSCEFSSSVVGHPVTSSPVGISLFGLGFLLGSTLLLTKEVSAVAVLFENTTMYDTKMCTSLAIPEQNSLLQLNDEKEKSFRETCGWDANENPYFSLSNDYVKFLVDSSTHGDKDGSDVVVHGVGINSGKFERLQLMATIIGDLSRSLNILSLGGPALGLRFSNPLFQYGLDGCLDQVAAFICSIALPKCSLDTCEPQDQCLDEFADLLECAATKCPGGEKDLRILFGGGDELTNIGAGVISETELDMLLFVTSKGSEILESCKTWPGVCNFTKSSGVRPCDPKWSPEKIQYTEQSNLFGLLVGVFFFTASFFATIFSSQNKKAERWTWRLSQQRLFFFAVSFVNTVLLLVGGTQVCNSDGTCASSLLAVIVVVYFVAVLICVRFSLAYFLTEAVPKVPKQVETKDTGKTNCCACSRTKACIEKTIQVKWYLSDPASPLYVPKFVLLEIVETFVQLNGLVSTLGNTPAAVVLFILVVQGVNMILVPLCLCVILNSTKHKTLATVVMLLIELGIDRTIFIGNVVLRGTADSDDVFSIFSSHASILFPATLTLLDLDDMFVMARRKNPEKKIDLPYSGFTRQINSKPARIFLGLGTACWAFSGVLLIFYGLNSYVVQKKICAQYFGDAVGCLGPNLWYRDGLFQTSCAVENITHFDCGGKNVVDVPENPSVYNNMESLTTINFSNCPNLKTVPLSFGNLTNLNYLDLSNTNPTKLPLDLLRMESLVEINLDNTPVSKRLDLSNLGINRIGLSRTAISAFSSSLTFLNLSSNNFRADPTLRTTVPYSDFNEDYIKELLSLTSLKQIDLSHNKVRSVKSNNLLRELFFRNNDSDSSVLLLEGNYIESIYMSTIVEQQVESCGRLVEAIGNLESPRISYVGYTTSWHAQGGGLPFSLNAFGRNGNRLTTLNIEQTTLTKVPDLSPVAFSLEKLYLGKNQFNNLEASLPLMPNLKHLRLDQCCVGSKSFYTSPFPQDPSFFGKIPSVNRLDLGKNKITHLRREISHLRMLKNLDLDSNNIVDEGFPSSIVNLNLTALHVDNNKLTKYPVSLQQMQNSMVRLSLNGMPTLVATLPSWFWSASKMSSIDLANCSLTSVPLGLQNLTELHHVDLGGNNLSTIPTWLNRQTFSNFENLVVHDIYNKKFDVDNPLLPKSCFFLRKGYVDVFRNKVNKRRCTAVSCLVSPIQIEKLCSKGEFLSDCAEPCAYFRETVGKYCKGANGGY